MILFNRRGHRRHTFRPHERPRVELRHLGARDRQPLVGAVANLSVGGMAVLLAAEVDPVELRRPWSARFALALPDGPVALTLDCTAAHWHSRPGGHVYGLQFVGIDTPCRAAEWRALVQFLRAAEAAGGTLLRPAQETLRRLRATDIILGGALHADGTVIGDRR